MTTAAKYRATIFSRWAMICLISAAAAGLPVRAARAGVFDAFDSAVDAIQTGFDFVWPDDFDVDNYSVKLGLGVGTTPDYTGSDDYRLRIVPLIDIRYKDHWAIQGTKFRYNLLRQNGFYAGPILNFRFGRNSKRNPALQGFESISNTLDVGGFVEYRKGSLVANADIRKALGAEQGLTAQMTLAQGLYQSKRFALGAAGRAQWGSKKNIQTNFGITDTQSIASGLPAYDAGGGVSSMGGILLARYQLTEQLRLEGVVAVFRLVGNAADSPLVRDVGSPTQGFAGLGFRYSF